MAMKYSSIIAVVSEASPVTHTFHDLVNEVECSISDGMPSLNLLGISEEQGARDVRLKVKNAIIQSGFVLPNKSVTVAISSVDIQYGELLDARHLTEAIATSILMASEQIPNERIKMQSHDLKLDGRVIGCDYTIKQPLRERENVEILNLCEEVPDLSSRLTVAEMASEAIINLQIQAPYKDKQVDSKQIAIVG